MLEPTWLSLQLIEAIHNRQLAEHGGLNGIRDRSLLESAIERPRTRFACRSLETDLPELAAAYAYGLTRNHPFMDGNKRTAYVACRTFLVMNGWDLVGSLHERYPIFLVLAAGELDENALIHWLRKHARPDGVSESGAAYERG